jgi:hypothetical protein
MSFSLAGNKITIEQGSTYSLTLNWTDSNGDTIPLVTDTWTARMKGREDKESSTEVFSWTSGSELIHATSNVYKIISGVLQIDREVTR